MALAERVSALAAQHDAEPVPELSRSLEIAVDVADPDRLRAFWAAALDYREALDGSLYDPYARGPSVWFQRTDKPSDNRLHLDLSVAAETADRTVAQTVASGGEADPTSTPAFTVLTDLDGNRVCISRRSDATTRPDLTDVNLTVPESAVVGQRRGISLWDFLMPVRSSSGTATCSSPAAKELGQCQSLVRLRSC